MLKQLEAIEEGQINNAEELIPHIFQFLVLLSYENYHSKVSSYDLQINNAEELIPHIFQFLVLLSYENYHSKVSSYDLQDLFSNIKVDFLNYFKVFTKFIWCRSRLWSFRKCSGSGFECVSGSGLGIRIRIQAGYNCPTKKGKILKFHV